MKRLFSPILFFILTLSFTFIGNLSAEQLTAVDGVRYFERISPTSVQASQAKHTASDAEISLVSFSAFGRQFDVHLEPNELLAPRAETIWLGAEEEQHDALPQVFYKGHVQGEEGSWVRLRVQDGELEGMIWTQDEIYVIEPGTRFLGKQSASENIIYRSADVLPSQEPLTCQMVVPSDDPGLGEDRQTHDLFSRKDEETPRSFLEEYDELVSHLKAAAGGATQELEISVVADHKYYLRHGSSTATDILSIMNQVDGIYSSELGVALKVAELVIITSASQDPFPNTADPFTLLIGLSGYASNPASPAYGFGLTHLFTGRSLTGNVIGVAWLNGLCSNYYGAGLSQDWTSWELLLVLLTAHEIGHNFNAPHDNQGGSACQSTPFGSIMNPFIDPGLKLKFSTCSKQQIAPVINRASCLGPLSGPVSCAPSLSPIKKDHKSGQEAGTLNVGLQNGCEWTAESNEGWLAITSSGSGSGSGEVTYTVAANTGAPRTGTIRLFDAEQTFEEIFTVNQTGCTYNLSPKSRTHKASQGSSSVKIVTQKECPWEATSNAPWITVTGASSGSGTSQVKYAVAANPNATPRTGTLSLGGQTYTVNQQGGTSVASCTYTLSPTSRTHRAKQGISSVKIVTQKGCPWEATSNASWITIMGASSGSGMGQVKYAVAVNPDATPRAGTLSLGGQTYTVNQQEE